MAYVLEHEDEAERLERQARLPAYQIPQELRGLQVAKGERILDAGCGSGLVARHLANEHQISVEACDFSELRLRQAKQNCRSAAEQKIRFFESSLEAIQAPDSTYDLVVCRYVFEHLKSHEAAAGEFFRILRPGGRAYIIDFDGIMFNITHSNRELAGMMSRIEAEFKFDFFIGRKLPRLLAGAGFRDIWWDVDVVSFRGPDLITEQAMMHQRFTLALPSFAKILGSDSKAEKFRDLYCDEMMKQGSTLFYNKFLVQGIKPLAGG